MNSDLFDISILYSKVLYIHIVICIDSLILNKCVLYRILYALSVYICMIQGAGGGIGAAIS